MSLNMKGLKKDKPKALSLEGVRVLLAIPMKGAMEPETFASAWALHEELLLKGIPVDLRTVVGNSLVHHARNRLVWEFLQSEATHLFFLDSDVVFDPEDVIRLLALATKFPVVCGSYPVKKDPITFALAQDRLELVANEYGLIPTYSGLGFTFIQRVVLEDFNETEPHLIYGDSSQKMARVFRQTDDGVSAIGEDIQFFRDCEKKGYSVLTDPSIELGHKGSKEFRGRLLDKLSRVDGKRGQGTDNTLPLFDRAGVAA